MRDDRTVGVAAHPVVLVVACEGPRAEQVDDDADGDEGACDVAERAAADGEEEDEEENGEGE